MGDASCNTDALDRQALMLMMLDDAFGCYMILKFWSTGPFLGR